MHARGQNFGDRNREDHLPPSDKKCPRQVRDGSDATERIAADSMTEELSNQTPCRHTDYRDQPTFWAVVVHDEKPRSCCERGDHDGGDKKSDATEHEKLENPRPVVL